MFRLVSTNQNKTPSKNTNFSPEDPNSLKARGLKNEIKLSINFALYYFFVRVLSAKSFLLSRGLVGS